MEHFHHGTGIIKYDPHRGDMRNRTTWWAVVEVDREITRYYRWWLKKEYHLVLEQPAWDAHISIFRGEPACGQHPELWKKYQNKRVDFLYEHGNIRREPDKKSSGYFYWVDVECPFLTEMRNEMGLPTGWRFHITIGRTYY